MALGLGQLSAVDNAPELEWRLARREAYDSLSALVQATQRSLSEPRAARPPLEPLERLQARSYQLLAQLAAVKSMLLLRRGRINIDRVSAPLQEAGARIEALLGDGRGMPAQKKSTETGTLAPSADVQMAPDSPTAPATPTTPAAGPEPLPDPFGSDLTPWLLRRLELTVEIAARLRDDAYAAGAPLAPLPDGTASPKGQASLPAANAIGR